MASSSQAHRSCVACYTYDVGKGSLPTPCCQRFVCSECARTRPRLRETCILCQLPIPQFPDKDDLPAYIDTPPGYSGSFHLVPEKKSYTGTKEFGVQHYVRKDDTINSLGLAYQIDPATIRKENHIFQDHLLQARSFVVIPGASRSLSESPGEGEERKVKLKRFMLATKCTDYDMAQTYMNECEFAVEEAVLRYKADSQWTREHAAKMGSKQ